MDHVSATNGLSKTERENISGARVFDGEDQGKFLSTKNPSKHIQTTLLTLLFLNFIRRWKQI